jgi:hypothetical protein
MLARPLGRVLHAVGEEAQARPIQPHVAEGTIPSGVGTLLVEGTVLGPAAAGGYAHVPCGHCIIALARKVDVLRLAEEEFLPCWDFPGQART